MSETISTDVVVIGSGPGGYTAAFRAADLGKQVTLVERYDDLGGVCLNVGCIPSKALLHIATVMEEAKEMSHLGVDFVQPKIDLKKMRNWLEKQLIGKLGPGIKALAKQRKVNVVHGIANFNSKNSLTVEYAGKVKTINFQHAIIAAGSKPIKLPFLPQDPRIMDSTVALKLESIPDNLLVIGGGIIGMEMATVYAALGSKVSVVELSSQLIPGADVDLVKPLQKYMEKKLETILLETKVTKVDARNDGLWVTFEGGKQSSPQRFDKILSAVGRVPNGKELRADVAGVAVDERGFIPVNSQMQTNVANIYAIGDVAGNPMLAHKAIPEGKLAAEVICGKKHHFQAKTIPSVAYTDPQVAWCGVTEAQAKQQGIKYEKAIFPWAACGKALAMARPEGLTKVLFEPDTNKLLGCGIVGPFAGDLIAEATLAIEMGCDAEDIALTIHPHPTLAETFVQAVEAYEGTITDLYMPKKHNK